MELNWKFFALSSAFFAALTAIFGKMGVAKINSDLATLIRTVIIVLILSLLVTVRAEWEPIDKLPLRSVLFLICSAAATGASWVCYYRALQLGPASSVAPLDKLSVVLVMIFAFAFLGEPLGWKTIVGGSLIAAGSLLIALA